MTDDGKKCTRNPETCKMSWKDEGFWFCKITGLVCGPWSEEQKQQQRDDEANGDYDEMMMEIEAGGE